MSDRSFTLAVWRHRTAVAEAATQAAVQALEITILAATEGDEELARAAHELAARNIRLAEAIDALAHVRRLGALHRPPPPAIV